MKPGIALSINDLVPRWFKPSGGTSYGGVSSKAIKVTTSGNGVLWVSAESLPPDTDIHHLRIQREGANIPALSVTSGERRYPPGYAALTYRSRCVLFVPIRVADLGSTCTKVDGGATI